MIPLILATVAVYGFVLGIFFIILPTSGGTVTILLPTVLQSCEFIINFIDKSILLPNTLKHLFDDVIRQKMDIHYNTLPRGILKAYLAGYYGETVLGKVIRYLLITMGPLFWLFRFILLFLVNLVPVIGPLLVIIIKAPTSGFNKHRRYFHLKGFSNGQIHYIWVNKQQFYFVYGFVTLALEAIPIIGTLFLFTNTIGAALWAIDIERKMTQNLLFNLHGKRTKFNIEFNKSYL